MLNPRTIALKLEHHLFKKEGALLQKLVPPKTQAAIRRRMRAKYLRWEARQYRVWLHQRIAARRSLYACPPEPGLLSILTPVWDGTPLNYFRLLVESIAHQNSAGATQWVIVDNGCKNARILAYLETLNAYPWIKLVRSPANAGIIGGMRLCLESAAGRYILPVDSDDWLYPDCLSIVTWSIQHHNNPPILYTDEDKLIGDQAVQPYLKPSFDPVLLLNSAYIAHLGVIDRKLALEHGAYADKQTEGSPDWDLFTRFYVAGFPAIHIPEVVYSWRMHPESTADDAGSKPYIHSSQKAVLQRYLDTTALAPNYEIEYSPILPGSCDWWLHRRAIESPSAQTITLSPRMTLAELANSVVGAPDWISLISSDLQIDRADWLSEALGLFERFPDTIMVGGRIRNSAGLLMSAGLVLGFGQACDCPDRSRPALDPGYFTQSKKQRSVSAVSSQFAVIRAESLRELAQQYPAVTVPMLGPWAGAWALRHNKRIIYSPYVSAVAALDWASLPSPAEIAHFRSQNAGIMPDHRFYPRALGLQPETAYKLAKEPVQG